MIGMGNTCKPMAVSFQCMTKSTTNKKKLKKELKNLMESFLYLCIHYTYKIQFIF